MLEEIRFRNKPIDQDEFPWTLPLVANFESLKLKKPVTFFVGENGSGKSTFLEAIAAAAHLPTAGSSVIEEDESLASVRAMGKYFSLVWKEKLHHGFFTRAEDFLGFARRLKKDIQTLNQEIDEVTEAYKGGDLSLAVGAIKGERDALIRRYGEDLEAMSHGEGFLTLFKARFTGKGLYLIDEPEAALSPQRQLSLISLIQEKVDQGCQFIIATHSPIIMAMPKSEIYQFNDIQITAIKWHDTEHYRITKQFLDHPESFLKHL
jgi:predicted ATPase